MKNIGYIYLALGVCVLILTILPPVFYLDIATLLLGGLLVSLGKDEIYREKKNEIYREKIRLNKEKKDGTNKTGE